MLKAEEAREMLKDRKFAIVAEKSGVPKQTIYSFMRGGDVKASTLEKLSDYLEGKKRKRTITH